jgi:hypothetical protein
MLTADEVAIAYTVHRVPSCDLTIMKRWRLKNIIDVVFSQVRHDFVSIHTDPGACTQEKQGAIIYFRLAPNYGR